MSCGSVCGADSGLVPPPPCRRGAEQGLAGQIVGFRPGFLLLSPPGPHRASPSQTRSMGLRTTPLSVRNLVPPLLQQRGHTHVGTQHFFGLCAIRAVRFDP